MMPPIPAEFAGDLAKDDEVYNLEELRLPYSVLKLEFLIIQCLSITLRLKISTPISWVVCRFWCIIIINMI